MLADGMSVKLAAKYAGLSIEDIKGYNTTFTISIESLDDWV
jgi:hypothetical protein